ncbi:hypothetical protein C8J57DRAFT_1538782 [Mycena rebaudengoi]|nr:hypothetical protein C8J57DRAFT_1538782 [Mycena rebaudengoi]
MPILRQGPLSPPCILGRPPIPALHASTTGSQTSKAPTDSTQPNLLFAEAGVRQHTVVDFTRQVSPPHDASETTTWTLLTQCICLAQWMIHLPPAGGGDTPPAPLAPPAAEPTLQASVRQLLPSTAFLPLFLVALGHVELAVLFTRFRSTAAVNGNRRTSRRGHPGAISDFITNVSIDVLVYPLVIPGDHEVPGVPTHEWAAHNQHLLTYVQQMQRHGLLLSFSVPRAGTVSPTDFTSKVRSGLAHSGLSLPDSPTPLSESQASELHYQPFALLTPNRRGTSHRFIPHPKINANFFTFAEFARLNKKVFESYSSHGYSAPRYGNIAGPISSPAFATQPLPRLASSSCTRALGFVFCKIFHGLEVGIAPDGECYDGLCPVVGHKKSNPHHRCHPHAESPPRRVRARHGSVGPVIARSPPIVPLESLPALSPSPDMPFSLLPLSTHPPLPTFDILQRQDVPPLQLNIDMAYPHEIYLWTVRLGAQVLGSRAPQRREGPAEPFLLPAGVFRCQDVLTKESFFKELPMLAIGPQGSGASAIGPGPTRAVYRKAIADVVEDHNYWQQAPSPSGPRPISMWLLLALIAGRDGMLIPQQYLAALDPVAFDRLAPWLTLAPEDEIPTSFMHPLCQFLMETMDMQPYMISSPRTRAEHDDWTITFMSKVLLGDTQLWTRPEFLAMRRGFNVTIGNTTLVEQFIQRRTALHLLSTLYDRQVRDIDDFSRRLVFRILMSTGHPAYLRGSLIQEDEFANKAEDSLLRARLFLGASSDSDLLPMSEAWTIKFNIVGLNAPTNPIFAETEPRALHFHTCSYEIDVKLTAPMQALLIAACNNLDDLTHTSPFDAWFHAQILGRDHNTIRRDVPDHRASSHLKKMSAAPTRRNPARNARVPRRADAPVSFALPPVSDSEDSDSDIELILPGGATEEGQALDPAEPGETSSDSTVTIEIRDSPTPDLGRESPYFRWPRSVFNRVIERQQEEDSDISAPTYSTFDSPDLDAVDTSEGTLQERADRLIAQIRLLQGNTADEDPAPISAVSSPHAPSPDNGESNAITGLQGGPLCLYFVSIQTLTQTTIFCQFRQFSDPVPHDGGLILRLQIAGGPVGRALRNITHRQVFYVGTSDVPVDMSCYYTHHQYNFREIASLQDMDDGPHANTLFLSHPVFSTALRAVANTEFTGHDPSLCVDAQPSTNAAAPTASGLALPVAGATADANSVTVQSYLLERFAAEYANLRLWRERPYGSAYNHCLTERVILSICSSLNIGLMGRTHTPAQIGGLTFHLDDVVSVAGINIQTFSTMRTEFRLIKEALVLLRRCKRIGSLPPAYEPLHEFLDCMLGDRVLEPGNMYLAHGASAMTETEYALWSILLGVRSLLQ